MVSHIEGERFLIAATLDAVKTDQEFETIPPHMTVARWFTFSQNHMIWLTNAMDRIFEEQDVYQKLVGGKARRYGERKQYPVREVLGAETGPSFAMRALIRSLGSFRADDVYANTFSPHVTNTPDRKVEKGEHLALPTVALISAHSEEPLQHVVKAFSLRNPLELNTEAAQND